MQVETGSQWSGMKRGVTWLSLGRL
uniref:Uncharacterized protein n=1 Tax=Anguilla anguilla TaxID=7936 RepID=A0A0E9RYX7_ANGAN